MLDTFKTGWYGIAQIEKKKIKVAVDKGITNVMIDKLLNYCHDIAIRSNSADLEAIKSVIYVSLFHCASSKK